MVKFLHGLQVAVVSIFCIIGSPVSHASDVQGVLGAALTFGGDTIDTFDIDGYYGAEQQDVKAGEFIYFYAGFDLQFSRIGRARTGLISTLGYHFSSINADNGTANFSRVPLDFLYYYQPSDIFLGLGGTYHVAVNYEADVPGYSANINFKNSPGLIAELGLNAGNSMSLVLRYTKIEYELDSPDFTGTLDGDNFGIGVRLSF